MKDIEYAKKLMFENNYTFVMVKNNNVMKTSNDKGIRPIFEAVCSFGKEMEGASVADRVIGKAAALLAAKGKVSSVYTNIISTPAKNTLFTYGISPEFQEEVDKIECIMEKLTLKLKEPESAYKHIKEFLFSESMSSDCENNITTGRHRQR
jgi:hypothetical protein